ncbi:hypothetical protein LTR84_001777 [Exophiala bonariae]|uniref:Ornithine carbamoyltransferase, mitochondrial n=1 Tax=Exophiala bonariae TaxID=1690606 RepID=A0AAV9NB99_9EURO|nr:hypothetical protein LTR84_001777 [Exophiala bonariae]
MAALRPCMRRVLVHRPLIRLASTSSSTVSSTASTASTASTVSLSSTPADPPSTPSAPRHFLRISDLATWELSQLIENTYRHKKNYQHEQWAMRDALHGKTVALMFSKLSTRTRVSTEGAVVAMGGHPMFLGKNDIQLGVNESLYDTSVVISSMVSGIVARVGPHSDIAELAKHSSAPVISGLCDTYHPLQAIADFSTMAQFASKGGKFPKDLRGLKIAWVGDANNVLHDLCVGAKKLGIQVAIATPEGYGLSEKMRAEIHAAGPEGMLFETNVPEEAVKGADVILTDTWISMGQEEEKVKRLKAFEGFTVTEELARRGGAAKDWKFMHCLPRHQEEVDDEVFYGNRSLVFPEAQNRLFAAIAAIECFIVNKGKVRRAPGINRSRADRFYQANKRPANTQPKTASAWSSSTPDGGEQETLAKEKKP